MRERPRPMQTLFNNLMDIPAVRKWWKEECETETIADIMEALEDCTNPFNKIAEDQKEQREIIESVIGDTNPAELQETAEREGFDAPIVGECINDTLQITNSEDKNTPIKCSRFAGGICKNADPNGECHCDCGGKNHGINR